MAQQQDAMEQVKEVVRQLIKYRFWISIGVAALFGIIAYALGSGPVRDKAKKEVAVIKSAETEVKKYTSPTIPTKDYKPIVEEKTQVLTQDVNTAWKTLYNRQAPLLTWPEPVQERFKKWGRKWPESEDASRVQLAIVDYIAAYKDYVDMVYKTFKPFDYETGEGIVVAAPKDSLLRPATFSDEHLPGLGKVWSAQERLWIQRTLLEVVAQVNKNAKDWNSAIIREIQVLEVGNPAAQDQRSIAKSEELTEAEKILAPGETEETAADAGGGFGGGMAGGGAMGGGKRGEMMGSSMMAGRMMGGGGFANQDAQSVYYVKSGNDQQYKILPVLMTVLIDQDHVQDLLVELENSPMSIEVKDFELERPTARVTKPEKGETAYAGGYGGGMMGQMGAMMGSMMRGRMTGYGGKMGETQNMMMQSMMMRQMGGMGRGGVGAVEARKGTDVRNKKRAEERSKQEEAVKKSKGPSLVDPFFDIVQVTVYGQARFFSPPPAEATAEPSPGETAAAPDSSSSPAAATSPDAKGAPAPTPGPQEKAAARPESGAAPKTEGTAAGKTAAPPESAKTDSGSKATQP